MRSRVLVALVVMFGMLGLTATNANAVYRQAMCVPYNTPAQVNMHITTWIDSNGWGTWHVDLDSYGQHTQWKVLVDGKYWYSKTNDLYVYFKQSTGQTHLFKAYWNSGDVEMRSCSIRIGPW
jgi:hypothetical protein